MKPTTTSAASTAFCAEKIEGPGGFLWLDGNGKITAGNGTLDNPKPNAFSLVQIRDCPGATASCKAACYVHNLEKHAPATHALYAHNSREIRRIVDDRGLSAQWSELFGAHLVINCWGGFRWHVSGDVFSSEYAKWIADVCRESFPLTHWIYTRSFDHIAPLVEVSTRKGGNLALNLSCDADNYTEARAVARDFGGRLCYMTTNGIVPEDLPDGSVIFPDYTLRGGNEAGREWFDELPRHYKSFVCPVDYHGKSESRRCGPCDRCMK